MCPFRNQYQEAQVWSIWKIVKSLENGGTLVLATWQAQDRQIS